MSGIHLMMEPTEFEKRRQAAMCARKNGEQHIQSRARTANDIPGIAKICSKHPTAEQVDAAAGSQQAIRVAGQMGEPDDLFIRAGRTAVISIDRPIFYEASFWSWWYDAQTSPQIVRSIMAAVDDSTIDRISFDIHCPGGDVAGISDLISAIDTAAKSKPVIALVHDMAASAAFWAACRCSRIVATKSSMVGSIGAISVYYDTSGAAEKWGEKAVVITDTPHKAMGHYGVEITPEMIERESKLLADMSQDFRQAVTEKRGIGESEILAMAGSMHYGADALDRGLVDEISDSMSFYERLDNGEYDQYGPANNSSTELSGGGKQPSSQAAAQMENSTMTINVDDTFEAMTDEEKEEMRSKLGDGGTGDEENDGESASTEDNENTASTENNDEDEDENNGESAALTIAEAKAIVTDLELPEATANELVIEAVEKGYSEATLLRKCVKASRNSNAQSEREIEQEAGGSAGAIGGGMGSASGTSGGSAVAKYNAAIEAEMKKDPSLTRQRASRNVAVNQPKLAEEMNTEATNKRKSA